MLRECCRNNETKETHLGGAIMKLSKKQTGLRFRYGWCYKCQDDANLCPDCGYCYGCCEC